MAVSASQNVSFFASDASGMSRDAYKLFAQAQDGDREAISKVVEGNDYIVTATLSAVDEIDNLDIPRSAFGLDVTNAVALVKVRVYQWATTPTAATLCYSEAAAMFANIAGTLTVAGSVASTPAFLVAGAASQAAAVLSANSTNIRVALDPGSAAAQNAYIEVTVKKLQ